MSYPAPVPDQMYYAGTMPGGMTPSGSMIAGAPFAPHAVYADPNAMQAIAKEYNGPDQITAGAIGALQLGGLAYAAKFLTERISPMFHSVDLTKIPGLGTQIEALAALDKGAINALTNEKPVIEALQQAQRFVKGNSWGINPTKLAESLNRARDNVFGELTISGSSGTIEQLHQNLSAAKEAVDATIAGKSVVVDGKVKAFLTSLVLVGAIYGAYRGVKHAVEARQEHEALQQTAAAAVTQNASMAQTMQQQDALVGQLAQENVALAQQAQFASMGAPSSAVHSMQPQGNVLGNLMAQLEQSGATREDAVNNRTRTGGFSSVEQNPAAYSRAELLEQSRIAEGVGAHSL